MTNKRFCTWAGALLLAGATFSYGQSNEVGIFAGHGDVGKPSKPGALQYDAARGAYLVTGGGENMWLTNDAFHFVWKQVSGDVSLAADLRWTGSNGAPNAHRKACLIIRQSLDSDSPYVDAVVHGSGLTSLQCRETKGGLTSEVQANFGILSAPVRMQIEKRGNYVIMSVAAEGKPLQPSGGSFRVEFTEPFYIGLAVCAHDDKAAETAEFSKVEIGAPPAATHSSIGVCSALEVVPVPPSDRKVAYFTSDHIEAPNWSRDGSYFIINKNNRLYKMATNGEPVLVDTGTLNHINNDHGISPDGTLLAISDGTKPGGSRIYVLPITGGAPRLVTSNAPSYFHGWSPDGKTLAFCGQRNFEVDGKTTNNFDIYTIPVEGGQETRLTTDPGKDDGPDYSSDGKYIYFNSDRTGHMQVWRMNADGSNQEQITRDEYGNVFPHPSPDGRWVVFLSYPPGAQDHPANKDVILRLMPAAGGAIRDLGKMFGGQGTINVSSWAPNSRAVAYVSYLPF
jgi:Tol biopolymer transport system component